MVRCCKKGIRSLDARVATGTGTDLEETTSVRDTSGIQAAKVFSIAGRQDPIAIQIEEVLVKNFEQAHISEKSIQTFN